MAIEAVAIILGASEWPKSKRWPASAAFKNSAEDFKRYLLDSNGLNVNPEDLLYLFDDPRSSADVDEAISTFLATVVARNDGKTKDLILYYTGHGAFTEGDQKYCLALRSSRIQSLGASAYRMASLARTLNDTV